MKLSVIIPIYNSKNTIEELVKSITSCPEPEMEVILVDDGSTDGSGEVCDMLARKDARCRVIHKQNGGVSSARNMGIDAANGDYIYFCDSDDFVFLDELSEAIDCLNKGTDVLIFDYQYKIAESGKIWKSTFRLTSNVVLNRQYILTDMLFPLLTKTGTDMASLWNKFFKRGTIKKHSIRFEENVHKGEDWRFIVDFLAVSETAFYIPKILYEYRLDGSQKESKYRKEAGIHLIGSYKRKLELNKKYNLNAEDNLVWTWHAGVIGEIAYLARSDFDIKGLYKAICDELVQKSAKILIYTKKKTYIKNEVSRKYRIYAFLIRLHMPLLLRIAVKYAI